MRYLQLALRRAGQNIALDGIFGPKTCEAVKQVTGSSRSCVVEAAQWRPLLPYLNGTVSKSFPLVNTDVPYSSYMVEWIVKGLKARYPYIEIGEIGRSVMGKPIWYLKLGKGGCIQCLFPCK